MMSYVASTYASGMSIIYALRAPHMINTSSMSVRCWSIWLLMASQSTQPNFPCVDLLDFLGHHVSCSGITPLEENVQTIRNFPQSTSQHKLRRSIGLVNIYRRFIPHCATIMQLLNQLLTTETRYSTFDRCVLSDQTLQILCGRQGVPCLNRPQTPHICRSDKHAPCQARHLDFIIKFTSELRHVKHPS